MLTSRCATRYFLRLGIAGMVGLIPVLNPIWAEEDPKTLEEVNARIQGLEMELIQAQGERYRVKHQIEYSDQKLSPDRIKAKKLEGEVTELRKSYEDRLKIVDEPLRQWESNVAGKYREIADLELLKEAIQRELNFASASTNDVSRAGLVDHLQAEQGQMEVQISKARLEAQEMTNKVMERKREVTEKDKEAGKLLSQLQNAEKEYVEVSGRLQNEINEKPEVKALDDPRIELAAELQRMRELKKKLIMEQAQ